MNEAITPEHPFFHPLAPLLAEVERIEVQIATADRSEKADLKTKLLTPKAKFDDARKKLTDAIKARQKQVTRAVKDLGKLQEERDAREQDVKLAAEREITHLREAGGDLLRICSDGDEACRYFTVVGRTEIEENEFNLNLPRYVNTFEPETTKPLTTAISDLRTAETAATAAQKSLKDILNAAGVCAL